MHVCVGQFHTPDPGYLRFAAQLGATGVQMNTPQIPGERRWRSDDVAALCKNVEGYGLRLEAIENVPRSFYEDVLTDGPERDRQVEDYVATIRAVGEAGVPVLGHHFTPNWVWRTDFEAEGRGGAKVTAFDQRRAERERKVLRYRVDPHVGAHLPEPFELNETFVDADTMWDRYQRFAAEVLPEARRAGVRWALHPADPPLAGLGGPARIITSVDAFVRACDFVQDDPAWGAILCLGTLSETERGRDEVFDGIERLGRRGAIAYVHMRDVRGTLPSFAEAFLGEGNYDPAEAVLALDAVGFDGFLLDDHVPHMDDDTPWGHRSRAFHIGYLQGLVRMLNRVRS